MRRVDADFKGLQPVAVPQAFEREAVGGRGFETVQCRKGRGRAAFGTEPAEQCPSLRHQRVAALADARAQRAARRLGRGLGALARHIELPAVKWAAQAVALVAAIGEVGASVRAVAVEQAVGTLGVAEQHEVLSQHPHRFHRTHRHRRVQRRVELVEQRHRLPVAAQQFAPGRARTDLGDALVLFGFHARISCGTGLKRVPWGRRSRQFAPAGGPALSPAHAADRCIVDGWRQPATKPRPPGTTV